MQKLKSTNLRQLADELNAIDQECVDHNFEDGFDPQHLYDATSLPNFGGEEPEETLEIYSWDEKNFLRYDERWNITPREEEGMKNQSTINENLPIPEIKDGKLNFILN